MYDKHLKFLYLRLIVPHTANSCDEATCFEASFHVTKQRAPRRQCQHLSTALRADFSRVTSDFIYSSIHVLAEYLRKCLSINSAQVQLCDVESVLKFY